MSPPSKFKYVGRIHITNLSVVISLWNDTIAKIAIEGMNRVVIDLGDVVKNDSHPEIAVRNA